MVWDGLGMVWVMVWVAGRWWFGRWFVMVWVMVWVAA